MRIELHARRLSYYYSYFSQRNAIFLLWGLPMPHYGYSQSGQFKIYARFVRSCLSLSEDERLVLLLVLDRSVERGNSLAVISFKEFERGVVRKKAGNRSLVVRGTGLPWERVTLAIDALCEIGAITAYRQASSVSCHINETWLHPELPSQGPLAMLRLNESDYAYRDGDDCE